MRTHTHTQTQCDSGLVMSLSAVLKVDIIFAALNPHTVLCWRKYDHTVYLNPHPLQGCIALFFFFFTHSSAGCLAALRLMTERFPVVYTLLQFSHQYKTVDRCTFSTHKKKQLSISFSDLFSAVKPIQSTRWLWDEGTGSAKMLIPGFKDSLLHHFFLATAKEATVQAVANTTW